MIPIRPSLNPKWYGYKGSYGGIRKGRPWNWYNPDLWNPNPRRPLLTLETLTHCCYSILNELTSRQVFTGPIIYSKDQSFWANLFPPFSWCQGPGKYKALWGRSVRSRCNANCIYANCYMIWDQSRWPLPSRNSDDKSDVAALVYFL